MNIFNHYPNFEALIRNAFSDLIAKEGFHLKRIAEGFFSIYNSKVDLNIHYDKGDLFCYIIQPSNPKTEYNFFTVASLLYPNIKFNFDRRDIEFTLNWVANFCLNEMNTVMKGDFYWIHQYNRVMW